MADPQPRRAADMELRINVINHTGDKILARAKQVYRFQGEHRCAHWCPTGDHLIRITVTPAHVRVDREVDADQAARMSAAIRERFGAKSRADLSSSAAEFREQLSKLRAAQADSAWIPALKGPLAKEVVEVALKPVLRISEMGAWCATGRYASSTGPARRLDRLIERIENRLRQWTAQRGAPGRPSPDAPRGEHP